VAVGERFDGGTSMQGIFGQARNATNLNVRIEGNDTPAGQPIPQSVIVKLTFDAVTPASGWAFSLIDFDVDQVRMRAQDGSGNEVPIQSFGRWFVATFDANPPQDGVNIPSWDPAEAAVIGASSGSKRWRTTVEGNLTDTEAGSAWFQPVNSIRELTFEYQSLQEEATPSFHILLAACAQQGVAPTPSPAPTTAPIVDLDTDGIPDVIEGSGDEDNDLIPNYRDSDSDDDTVPDSAEGHNDTDGDGSPDFTDNDSDGDNVPDVIERQNDSEVPPPGDADDDQDGVDDAREDETNEPLRDSDSDGTPDLRDEDSDNDGTSDGDEAYDLDGDGDPDVEPSGKDEDGDGLDDAFEEFDDPDELNPEYRGVIDDTPPCQVVKLAGRKGNVRRRVNALAARVPFFAGRARSCAGVVPAALERDALATRASIERALDAAYEDRELRCEPGVCTTTSRKSRKARLTTLTRQLAAQAKSAKLAAIRACGEGRSDGKPDRRPNTATFLAQISSDIGKLPARVSRCGG